MFNSAGTVHYLITGLSLVFSGIVLQQPELEPYRACLNVFHPHQVYSKSFELWAFLKNRWQLDGRISSSEIVIKDSEGVAQTNLIDYKSFQGQIVVNDMTGKMYTLSPLPMECNVHKLR
jgi:hypothetical protein